MQFELVADGSVFAFINESENGCRINVIRRRTYNEKAIGCRINVIRRRWEAETMCFGARFLSLVPRPSVSG
jgi:hypothetical protein